MASPPSTVLIADDNSTNLNVLFEYLTSQGHRVLVAEDGLGAIEQAEYGNPDLILLDVMMPGLNGFETCERLKTSPKTKNIPVIFMTAISETPYILKGFSVGAVDYITKPLQQDEVNVRVKTHISIRQLQRELEGEIAVRQKAEEELRAINAGKDVFFSVLAHDLKNPMAGLLGLSEAMVDSLPTLSPAEVKEMAVELRNASRQIGELLFDLLEWAQMALGKITCDPTKIAITEEVEFVVALIGTMARTKGVKIVNDISVPTAIFCDRRMNDTVLRNLLSNAVKFTPSGGTIRISAKPDGDFLVLTVKDSGTGIPASRLPGLFLLGKEKPTFGTVGEKGTGLGLPLCRDMVEKNGGRIWAESTPWEGSSFHFTVPLAK